MDTLLPCPKCEESQNVFFKAIYNGFSGYQVWIVECAQCGYLVPIASSRPGSLDTLTSEWNNLPR